MTVKICKSWLNNYNKNIRCNRQCCVNSDFCRYHKRYSIYMPNLINNINNKNNKNNVDIKNINNSNNITYLDLDKKYIENLLGLYESWKDIPTKYWIILNNKYWDIRILLDIFSNNIITSEMENPKPTWPHDPFTRRNYTPKELKFFKKQCKELNLKVYIGLAKFLNAKLKNIYKQEYGTSNEMAEIIIKLLSKNLRYKLINSKNSQDCFIGYWVSKNTKSSTFEEFYKLYISMPFQIYIYDMGDLYISDNIHKKNVKNIIDNIKEEYIDLNCDNNCVYL